MGLSTMALQLVYLGFVFYIGDLSSGQLLDLTEKLSTSFFTNTHCNSNLYHERHHP